MQAGREAGSPTVTINMHISPHIYCKPWQFYLRREFTTMSANVAGILYLCSYFVINLCII
jgi:hypothetical protein